MLEELDDEDIENDDDNDDDSDHGDVKVKPADVKVNPAEKLNTKSSSSEPPSKKMKVAKK